MPETLDNILNQSLPPYEVIVADDHSTDGIESVMVKYKGRVTFVTNKGKGPGAGRNTGLEVATGDYIKYFDSDDVMTGNSLQVQAELLQKTGAPLVYSPYVHVRKNAAGHWEQADVVIQFKPIPSGLSLRQCMVRNFFTVIPGMMFRAEFLRKIGPWRTDITAYEDWDLLWRIGEFVPNPLHTNACAMFYRLHGAQTTGANFNNETRDTEKLICYTDALKSINGFGSNFTAFDKRILETQIWLTLGCLKHLPRYAELYNRQSSSATSFMDKYLRGVSKVNRLLTRSNWQLMHGINRNPEVFARFLKNIS